MNSLLDEKVQEAMSRRMHSLPRMLSLLKKDLDQQITEKLQQKGYTDVKLGDLVLIVNIDPAGIINNELAKKARITKQAMSKVAKNLEAAGYILTRKHENDNRASVIFLSEKGKQLLLDAVAAVDEIEQLYTRIIGEEDINTMRGILIRLVSSLYPRP